VFTARYEVNIIYIYNLEASWMIPTELDFEKLTCANDLNCCPTHNISTLVLNWWRVEPLCGPDIADTAEALNLPGPEVAAIFSDTTWRRPFDCRTNGRFTRRSQNANRHVGDLEQSNTGDPKLLAAVFQSPLIKWSHLKWLHQLEVTVM
jgi:hypothetical protein